MKDNIEAMMVPVMVSTCSSEECLKLSMLYIPHHTMLNLYILKEMSAKLTTHSMSGCVEGEGVEYHNGFTPIASEQFTHIIMHTLLYSAGCRFIHEEKRKKNSLFFLFIRVYMYRYENFNKNFFSLTGNEIIHYTL